MPVQENKALVQKFIDRMNKRELDGLEQFFTPDYVDHTRPGGVEGAMQFYAMFLAAFPDAHITAEDVIAEGDRVVTRLTLTATHRGEFMGLPATGRTIRLSGIDINRIAEGKLAERWANQDDLGVLQQLGIVPVPQPA